MISRRRFLALGPVIAATATAGPGSLLKGILPKVFDPAPESLTRSKFAAHLNSKFKLQIEPLRHTEVDLIEVGDLGAAGSRTAAATAQSESQFSLIFRGPREQAIAQNTYHLEHPRMGTLAIFLVPVGEAADGRHYQAIFNNPNGAPAPREA